jgi:hypothetical protein
MKVVRNGKSEKASFLRGERPRVQLEAILVSVVETGETTVSLMLL